MSSAAYSSASLQQHVRKAGLDPLGIEVVNLGAYTGHVRPREAATEHAVLVLSAAVAKARAFSGSLPSNLKPSLPGRMSRRSLLSLPILDYLPVPSVDTARCWADNGCQECVRACPHRALASVDGQIMLTKSRCTGCGICVSTCPNEAINLPGVSPVQLNAQITTLLSAAAVSSEPRGILFLCSNSERTLEELAQRRTVSTSPNWLPVRTPCVEMLPPSWLLAPLSLGAAAVAVLSCGDGCRSGHFRAVEERVAYSREMLRLLGQPAGLVTILPSDEGELIDALQHFPSSSPALESQAPANPFTFQARASVFLQSSRSDVAAPTWELEHPQSPFGVVEATDSCTLCGGCATVCPTRALVLDEAAEGSSLLFDSARCVACGDCVSACPEPGALRMRRTTDLRRLANGNEVLRHDPYQRCESCGKPIASEAMSRRIADILGAEYAGTVNIITRYCVECRGLLA
jgi:ferredoxin